MGRTPFAVLLLSLGFATAAAPVAYAFGPDAGAEAAQKKKKKKKPVKCKSGQIKERVKVGKRTRVRCVAAKKAWPAPAPVDMRTESTSYVLGANYAKVRDRRGRKAKSLPRLLKRVHPRAERALAAAAKAGLARMDARAGVSQAGAGCGGPAATVSSTFNAGGGQSVDLTMTGGPDASLQLGMESNQGNRRVRVEIEFPGCESHEFDSCPTAGGDIRGKDNRRIGVRAFLYEGGTLVWSQGIRLEGDTTFRGVVQDDAKLDFFEPHNTEVGTLTLGGTSRGFSPMSIRMLVQRITRVEYPEKTYSLGPSTVNATITSPDLSGAELTAAEHQIEGPMRQQADQQFRDIINKGIGRYDDAETRWNGANNCATIKFTPASNDRPLRVGDNGTVSGNLVATRGGSPSTATWTHLVSGNGTFTPGSASSVPASFNYAGILQAGPGIFVTGTWKAVSKAGVAQATWSQPTKTSSINTITGTFSGSQVVGNSLISWSGEAAYVRTIPGVGADGAFQLQHATYTVVASGKAELFPSCTQSGTKTVTQSAGDFSSTGQEPSRLAPYDYTGSAIPVSPFDASMMVDLSGCDPDDHAPSQAITSLAFTPLKAIGRSDDGVNFSGSRTESYGALTWNWNWALTGAP